MKMKEKKGKRRDIESNIFIKIILNVRKIQGTDGRFVVFLSFFMPGRGISGDFCRIFTSRPPFELTRKGISV